MFYLSKKTLPLLIQTLLTCFLLWQNYFWFEINKQFKDQETKILYSKEQSIQPELIKIIQQAESFAYFSVYTFTSEEIVSALVAAKLRGVEVKGILDRKQTELEQEKPILRQLRNYGIPLLIPNKSEGIMHTKFLVTENAYASGSYNWTFSANSINDEVLEIGKAENQRKAYEDIFKRMHKRYGSGG